jgi:hypothetical protein
MEIPSEVLIHNEQLGLKGARGTLIRIAPEAYYEVTLRFGNNTHRVLLPAGSTVIINAEPETAAGVEASEVER